MKAGYFPIKKWWGFQIAVCEKRLSPRAKLTFARLIEHHNTKTGRCDPSEIGLAAALGCSERTIRAALRELEKLGFITVHRRAGGNGRNAYSLNFPTGKSEYASAVEKRVRLRKKSAVEPKKEPKKKPLKRPRPNFGSTNNAFMRMTEDDIKKLSENRAQLEAALCEQFGGGAEGWDVIMKIDASILDQAAGAIYSQERDIPAACQWVCDLAGETR